MKRPGFSLSYLNDKEGHRSFHPFPSGRPTPGKRKGRDFSRPFVLPGLRSYWQVVAVVFFEDAEQKVVSPDSTRSFPAELFPWRPKLDPLMPSITAK